MFDQTFVDGTEKTSKPLTLLASTLIQIAVLCILLLIPLIYTATLPGPIFKTLLMAPRPPVAAVVPNVPKVRAGRMIPVFNGAHLIAPVAIPKQVNPANDLGPAPDVAGAGIAGLADGPFGSPVLGAGTLTVPPAPAPSEPAKPKPVSGPVRVGTGVAEANLVYKVVPAYPALAKTARIQGTVEFSATISKTGNIENLQVVRGHPLLINAAKEAVLQWKYRPTLLNGQPVEVLTEIVVNFTLTQ